MPRPAKRAYGKWMISNQSPRPLLTIQEEQQSNSNEENSSDPFDRLLKSPLKRDVDFKPLSHWAKKVEELTSKEKASKAKGLYDFSSPDETLSSIKKKPRKPRPRKKKENLLDNIYRKVVLEAKKRENSRDKTGKNATTESQKKRPALAKIENKTVPQRERIFVQKTENNADRSMLNFHHPPLFGLSSTPGMGLNQKLVKPSYFDFVSPITSNAMRINSCASSLTDTPTKRPSPKQTPEQLKLDPDGATTPKRRTISESASPDSPTKNDDFTDNCDELMTPDEKSGFRGFSSDDLIGCPRARPTSIDQQNGEEAKETNVCLKLQTTEMVQNDSGKEESPLMYRNVTIRRKNLQSSSESTIDEISMENKSQSFVVSPSREKNVTLRRRNLRSSLKTSMIDEISIENKSQSFVVTPSREGNVTLRRRNLRSSLKTSTIASAPDPPIDRRVTHRKRREPLALSSIDDIAIENKSQSFVVTPSREENVTLRRRNLRSSLKTSTIESAHDSPINTYVTRRKRREIETTNHPENGLQSPPDSSFCSNSLLLGCNVSGKDEIEKLSSLESTEPSCYSDENISEQESTVKEDSEKSVIHSDSTVDSESCNSSQHRCSTISPVGDTTAKSQYFANTIEETPTSSSSMIDSSSPERKKQILPEKTENEETDIQQAPDLDANSEATLMGNKTLMPVGPIVLKGGKNHTRALSVLRQIQTGRLTFMNQSIIPQAPPGRGRGYESFVSNLLETQPGFEESILGAPSPDIGKTRYSRTRASCLAQARQSILQKSILRNRMSCAKPRRSVRVSNNFSVLANRTVHWRDSVVVNAREPTVAEALNESRMNRSQFCNVSICVVPAEKHEPTAFRVAYGIEDQPVAGIPIQLSARDVTLARCGQDAPLDFSEYFNEDTLPDCVKIGEGVYGEVFMYNSKEHGPTVFKVIPIEGDLLVNDEPQKTFNEILSEIVSTMELSNLRYGTKQNCSGFVEVRKCWCVQGEYPDLLLDLWCDYDVRKSSDNDSPSNFEEDQLYIVLELAHGGQDLESFVFQNAKQSAAAFRQATLSLAVAERALQFEHRDFHWGNVLLATTTDRTAKFILDGVDYDVPTEGVKVTIIDFTLSRLTFEGCSVFNDLSVDPALFTSEGDYQFEIYRMMKEETGNNWELFKPKTNIFWLHYTLDKMSTMVRYKRPRSKLHLGGLQKLNKWKNSALDYASAADLVPHL